MIGYFGKVSTHGDFVSRGLPPDLVAAWDAWLQQCMLASQQQLGDQWLTHYLTSPVWRFAISPGILSPEGLAGVMMPSVDRVGRYFPLMIGATGAPPLLDWFEQQAAWYEEIEALARASLDSGFRLEQFDSAPEPNLVAATDFSSADNARRYPLDHAIDKRTLWWTEASPSIDASFRVSAGMPAPQVFVAMLDGSWISIEWN